MPRKKRGRVAPSTRLIENTEAALQGLPLPHVPKVRTALRVPGDLQGIMRAPKKNIRYWLVALTRPLAERKTRFYQRSMLGELVFCFLKPLCDRNVWPKTVEGLMSLGDVRMRFMREQAHFLQGGKFFALPRRRKDLTTREFATRLATAIKELDLHEGVTERYRPDMPDADAFRPEPVVDPPSARPKVAKLMDRRREYLERHVHVQRAVKSKWAAIALKCGCLVKAGFVRKKRYFWVHSIDAPCSAHTDVKYGRWALTRRDVVKEPVRPKKKSREARTGKKPTFYRR